MKTNMKSIGGQSSPEKTETQIVTIEKPSGPVHIPPQKPEIMADRLYNEKGHLFWNGTDLTNVAQASSKWTQSGNGVFLLGKVGIGTNVPASDLDVAGSVKAKSISVEGLSGVLMTTGGPVAGGASLSDLSDVSVDDAPIGSIILKTKSGWAPASPETSLRVSHGASDGLNDDDHPQYFNDERHSKDAHNISKLSVADGSFEASFSGTSAKHLTISNKLVLPGKQGMLIAKNDGSISAEATTDDLPEGTMSLYFSENRVSDIGDGRYLMLDGSNMSTLKMHGTNVKGLDADSVDGMHSSDIANVNHVHSHATIENIGENDHHRKKHDLLGSDHGLPQSLSPGMVLAINSQRQPYFSNMDMSMISGNISASRIGNGELNEKEIEAVKGARKQFQEQIDEKSDSKHSHDHASLRGTEHDDHFQYLTEKRADDWLSKKSSDDIIAGKQNRFVNMAEILSGSASMFLAIDGSNAPQKEIPGLNASFVCGIGADGFSKVNHRHDHSELNNAGPDDHHPKIHSIESHTWDGGGDGTVLMLHAGHPSFSKISMQDLPDDVASTCDIGQIRLDIEETKKITKSLSEKSHSHSHSSLTSLNADDHPQYTTDQKVKAIIRSSTADDISDGKEHKFVTPGSIRSTLKLSPPLYYDINGDLSISLDLDRFTVDNGVLKIQYTDFPSISTQSISVANGKLEVGESETATIDANLSISGELRTNGIAVDLPNGIASVRSGKISSGATLGQIEDVAIKNATDESILMMRQGKWVATHISDVIPKQQDNITGGDVVRLHKSMDHDVPSLRVGDLLNVDPVNGNISINTETAINTLDVNGGVAIGQSIAGKKPVKPGTLAVDGAIGIGTNSPREGLDTASSIIVGGRASRTHANTLDLSSSQDIPTTTLKFSGGGSIDLSAGPSVATFRMDAGNGKWVSLSKSNSDVVLSTEADGRVSISTGKQEIIVAKKSGVGFGVGSPKMQLDAKGNVGVSDGSSKPESWMMLRAISAVAPPSICFPITKSLKIGTLQSYDTSSVWQEKLSIEPDGSLLTTGKIVGNITEATLSAGENNDIETKGSPIIFLKSEPASLLSGLTGGVKGAMLIIVNTGDEAIHIVSESTGSSPINRFAGDTAGALHSSMIAAKRSVMAIHDGQRWFIAGN